jgi:tetrahydromethanopterin S-methyltransferase subunit G
MDNIEENLNFLKILQSETDKENEERLKDLERKLNFLNDSKKTNIGKISFRV